MNPKTLYPVFHCFAQTCSESEHRIKGRLFGESFHVRIGSYKIHSFPESDWISIDRDVTGIEGRYYIDHEGLVLKNGSSRTGFFLLLSAVRLRLQAHDRRQE
jgi:hypothetical protein